MELLCADDAVINVVRLDGVAQRPDGDVVFCDVAREDASVILWELRNLGLAERGSISADPVETSISKAADAAIEAAEGSPADAVLWEQVSERTSESASLSWVFLIFMVMAAQIAGIGIYLDSAILIVGAMVVGPEFGPVAGFSVAMVRRRGALAWRSFLALLVGFPLAIGSVWLAFVVGQWIGFAEDQFDESSHSFSNVIAAPDVFAVLVALFAGVAGMLSLSTAKSGALIGVLISVTTIPAAANIGVALAYSDGDALRGSALQLVINVAALLASGTATLWVQRVAYERRRARHLRRVDAELRRSSPATTTPPSSSSRA